MLEGIEDNFKDWHRVFKSWCGRFFYGAMGITLEKADGQCWTLSCKVADMHAVTSEDPAAVQTCVSGASLVNRKTTT